MAHPALPSLHQSRRHACLVHDDGRASTLVERSATETFRMCVAGAPSNVCRRSPFECVCLESVGVSAHNLSDGFLSSVAQKSHLISLPYPGTTISLASHTLAPHLFPQRADQYPNDRLYLTVVAHHVPNNNQCAIVDHASTAGNVLY